MNISEPFIRRPVMTSLLMLALLLCGLFAFWRLPVSDLPNIEYPRINVEVSYAGASPETMVNLVTKPLEKELINVKGVREISSRSSRGSAAIHLDFELSKNLDEAAREVQAALSRAESDLPTDLTQRPSYHKKEASQGHIAYLVLTSPSEGIATLREYSDLYIEPRLSRIEGVAGVDIFGAPYAIKIYVNPDLMAARHVGIDQLFQAIQKQNGDRPLGVIETGAKKLSIELAGGLQTVQDFENLIVAPGPVRLKEIASVSDKGKDNGEFHYVTKEQNHLALTIGIQKVGSGNTIAISKAIQAALPEIARNLPPSMELKLWFDKAVWIQESIFDVQWSLGIAIVLVVGVIYLSLGRLSEALIPSIALPMSLVGTFIAMYWLNFSLDILSMLALTLSIGFVVDDAIVVVENIVRHNSKSDSIVEASLKGSKEICFTILSMTLSLVVVFTPLLLMGGMHGRLFHEFSLTLAIAILISGAISLTLTPMLCSRWLPPHGQETRLQAMATKVNQTLVGWYGKTLNVALKFPKTILLVACGCFIATLPLFQQLPVDLFPKEDRGFMYSIVNLPAGLSPQRTRDYQAKIEKLLQDNAAIESFIGLSQENTQIFVIRLLPQHLRVAQEEVIEQVQQGIDAIPGTRAFTMAWQLINVDLDIANGGDYRYLLQGLDPIVLKTAADKLLANLQGDPSFSFARLDVQQDSPKLTVDLIEEKVQQQGLSLYGVQTLLQQLFSGGTVAHVQKNGQRYKVSLSLDDAYGKSSNALGNVYLHNADGTPIPLKSIAHWEEKLGSPTIRRVDQLPTIGVSFALAKEIAPDAGLQLLEQSAAEILPEGVRGVLRGSAAMIASASQETAYLLLAAALVMYIVLGMLYESFIHPLTILSSLPFAGLGGVLTLLLFNEPLSIYSIVGFLLLIGIVKKNGIMVVDFALEMRKDPAVSAEKAIYDSCLVRFRPIIMTTVAAIMGALPIAIGFGEGAGSRRGLGLVIVGGLLFSQVLILYVTPVIYLLLERLFSPKVLQSQFNQ